MNAKLTEVSQSLRQISTTFNDWQTRFNKYAEDEHCHFNLNQEFLAPLLFEVNKAMTALLRLNEIDDLFRQLTHVNRKKFIGFPDFPRFLTEELDHKLSTEPSRANTIDALRRGLSLMMDPLVDFRLPPHGQCKYIFCSCFPRLTAPSPSVIWNNKSLSPISSMVFVMVAQ